MLVSMYRSIALALVGGMVLSLGAAARAQSSIAADQSASAAQPPAAAPPAPPPDPPSPSDLGTEKLSGPQAALEATNPAGGLPALPPLPPAKDSTIFGGAIRHIDPVRDQFQLDIYGQRPLKVLFDERTQVFRDGVRVPVRNLRAADHASVQTALDGTRIFAISIHILSAIPKGEYRGRVLRFDESNGELQIDASPSPRPFTIYVPAKATIVRKGQHTFAQESSGRGDLKPGALVDVTFGSGAGAGAVGVANHIVVLAVPGSSFLFTGRITALDLGAGSLTLVDPRDQKSYQISFDPRSFPASGNMRIGQNVRLTASYNGTTYVASDITAN